MYYILEDIKLLETYKEQFVGNKDTVRYSLDKNKFIVESKSEIKELKDFEYTKDKALKVVSSVEWTKEEDF